MDGGPLGMEGVEAFLKIVPASLPPEKALATVSLATGYVGEGVAVCCLLAGPSAALDRLQSTGWCQIEGFELVESKRIFSDGSLSRMRSVDSLNSMGSGASGHDDDGPQGAFSLAPIPPERGPSAVFRLSDDSLLFVIRHTLQSLSDASCSIRCKLTVSIRNMHASKPAEESSALPDSLVDILRKEPSLPIECRSVSVLRQLEHEFLLCNPFHVEHRLQTFDVGASPRLLLTLSCSEPIELLEYEAAVIDAHQAHTTARHVNSLPKVSVSLLPLTTNVSPPTLIQAGDHDLAFDLCRSRSHMAAPSDCTLKLDLCVRPGEGRQCALSFEAPLDLSSLSGPSADDLSISFSTPVDSCKLYESVSVTITICNRSAVELFDIALSFPLSPSHSEDGSPGRPSAFVCMERDLRVGQLGPGAVFQCTVPFVALGTGRNLAIPLVQLIDRDRIVDLCDVLHLDCKE